MTEKVGLSERLRPGPKPTHHYEGQHIGGWTIIGRSTKSGYWDATCDCGTVGRLWAPDIRRGPMIGCRACTNLWLRHEVPRSYRTAHRRVYEARGQARGYLCVDCGQQAQEWSYDGTDPDQMWGDAHGSVCAFSADVMRYQPRCVPDHRRHDVALRMGVEA